MSYLSVTLTELNHYSSLGQAENLRQRVSSKELLPSISGRTYDEHFSRGENGFLKHAHHSRVRPMLEPERQGLAKSHYPPQLQIVPKQEDISTHWTRLADVGNEAAYCAAWLSLQCTRLAGVTAGLLMLRQEDKPSPAVSASWPAGSAASLNDFGELCELAKRAFQEQRTIVFPASVRQGLPQTLLSHLVAIPLGVGGQIIAAAAVKLDTSTGSAHLDVERVVEQLRWGAGWLESLPLVRRLEASSGDAARALSCLDLLAAVEEQPRLLGMTIAIANNLATTLQCDRVSVGLRRRGGRVRLSAISHSATFKKAGRLVDAIESAMEEAIDQGASVTYPPSGPTDRAVTMAHRALAEVIRTPGAALMSVVLADSQGRLIGAITFERHSGAAFDKETLQLVEAIAALLGPIVHLQMRANRPIAGRIVDSAGRRPRGAAWCRTSGLEVGCHLRRRSRSGSGCSQKPNTVLVQDRWWKRRYRGPPSSRSKGSFARLQSAPAT